MSVSPKYLKTPYFQWASISGEGMQLELCFGNESGGLGDEKPYPAAAFIATDDDQIWMEIQLADTLLRINLDILEKAIQMARKEVRSEVWYDKNL